MANSHASVALAMSTCMCCTGLAAQSVPAIDFYGSLRTQLEAVSPETGRSRKDSIPISQLHVQFHARLAA